MPGAKAGSPSSEAPSSMRLSGEERSELRAKAGRGGEMDRLTGAQLALGYPPRMSADPAAPPLR
jgi:biotin synthase-related radical SAM superfamily protein